MPAPISSSSAHQRIAVSKPVVIAAVGAILSYLDIGAITDPAGSRWPDGTDVPAFIGSITDVIAKVTGRLNSTPQQPTQEGPR